MRNIIKNIRLAQNLFFIYFMNFLITNLWTYLTWPKNLQVILVLFFKGYSLILKIWNTFNVAQMFIFIIMHIYTSIIFCSLQGESWLSWVFEKVVLVMVFYFILSIINSMAQSYVKRLQQKKNSEEKTKWRTHRKPSHAPVLEHMKYLS